MRRLAATWGATAFVAVMLAILVVQTTNVVTDLSFFLPDSRNVESRALAAGFDRPGSLMMVRLSGPSEGDIARISDRLVRLLRADPLVAFVRNGRPWVDPQLRDYLLTHRYLLGPDFGRDHFSEPALKRAIGAELAGLAGAAGWATRDIFPRDPVGRYRAVIPTPPAGRGPERRHGVWMDSDGRALLLIQFSARAGDTAAQAMAMNALNAALAAERTGWPGLTAEVSGPGVFALRASEKIRADMMRLTLIASVAVAALLLLMYRSGALLLLAGIPVGLGVLSGILITQAVFGSVHGVAITFGVVLAGVTVDYPIHLFGHRRPGEAATVAAQRIARPMTVGAATTLVGVLALTQSSFPGLAQIGVLSATGVAVSLAVSRYVLPVLMADRTYAGRPIYSNVIWTRLRGLRRPRLAMARLLALGFLVITAVAFFRPEPVWETDLSRIGVADGDARALDGALRKALHLPDVRRALVIEGDTEQDVLAQWPETLERLDVAIEAGRLGGYPAVAGLLPPEAKQRARQADMPSEQTLRQALTGAVSDLPVAPSVLSPFLADIENQKHAQPLLPDDLRAGPLGLLYPFPWQTDSGWAAMVPLTPPIDLSMDDLAGARLVDLAAVAQDIVRNYRAEATFLLLVGLGIGAAVLAVGLQSFRRLWRVLLPPAGAVALTAGLLLAAGVSLNLFHLLALLLVASIGVDYALFFPDYSASDQDGIDGFRSVGACCGTSTVVFAVLATSSIPVLSAIGTTVAIGALLSFVLTLCLAGGSRST